MSFKILKHDSTPIGIEDLSLIQGTVDSKFNKYINSENKKVNLKDAIELLLYMATKKTNVAVGKTPPLEDDMYNLWIDTSNDNS